MPRQCPPYEDNDTPMDGSGKLAPENNKLDNAEIMCEYTDKPVIGTKKQIIEWIPASYHPEQNTPIVCATANGKIQTFKGIRGPWERYAEKYNIAYWAYQCHILPELRRESAPQDIK